MYCSNCGTRLNDGAKFCSQCGAPVKSGKNNFISIRCEDCGGTMTVDEDRTIVSCPYCGSAKLVNESDSVKIQRIKSKSVKETELGKEEIRASVEKEKSVKEAKKAKYEAIEIVCLLILAGLIVLFCFAYLARF